MSTVLITIGMVAHICACGAMTFDFCRGNSEESIRPSRYIFNRYEICFLGTLAVFIFLLFMGNIADNHLELEEAMNG